MESSAVSNVPLTGAASWDERRSRTCGEPLQRVTGQPETGPLVLCHRAECLVEPDGRFVPVEYGPFEPGVPALNRDLGQLHEECPAMATAAYRRGDVEILQVDPVPAGPGRV